jgi:hypothetical protein
MKECIEALLLATVVAIIVGGATFLRRRSHLQRLAWRWLSLTALFIGAVMGVSLGAVVAFFGSPLDRMVTMYRVEYHPSGNQPGSYTSGWDSQHYELISAVLLKDSWYLAQYRRSPAAD